MKVTHAADNLEIWSLIFALSFRLDELRLCQSLAEIWRRLVNPIWYSMGDGSRIASLPKVKRWAEMICHRRGQSKGASSDSELCRALGRRLAGKLARLARGLEESGVRSLTCEEFIDCLPQLRLQSHRHASRAIEDLYHASLTSAQAQCPFFVNPASNQGQYMINLDRQEEQVNIERFRVRPHRFRVCGLDTAGAGKSQYRVGQIVRELATDGTIRVVEWDTIPEGNPTHPFWPLAPKDSSPSASHRCAVHISEGCLAWSDWPQIQTGGRKGDLPRWQFITGLFSCHEQHDITRYDLEARIEWDVDWRIAKSFDAGSH